MAEVGGTASGSPDTPGVDVRRSSGTHGVELPPATIAAGPPMREYLLGLRRRAWLIVLLGTAGAGVGALVMPDEGPQYRALTVLHLTDTRQTLAGTLEREIVQPGGEMPSQIELIRSRGIAEEAVKATGYRLRVASGGIRRQLIEDVEIAPEEISDTIHLVFGGAEYTARLGNESATAAYGDSVAFEAVRFSVASKPDVERGSLVVIPLEAAILEVRRSVYPAPRGQTQIIDVLYTADDPWMALRCADAVAEAFQAWGTRLAQTQSRDRRVFVQEQLRHTDSLMLEAQLALGKFRQRQQAYNAGERFAAQEGILLDLDIRREEMITDHRAIDSLLTTLRRSPDPAGQELQVLIGWPTLSANPLLTQLFGRLTEFEAERDKAVTGGRATTNPDVQRLDSLIANTRRNLVTALESHLTALAARIDVLSALKQRTSEKLSDLPFAEAEQVRLEQRMETMREMGILLRQELHRASIAEAVQAPHAEIVDRATIVDIVEGSSPRTILIGLLAGLFLGGFGSFLLEALDTSIRRREEIEPILHVPGLAVVPRLPSGERPRIAGIPYTRVRNGARAGLREHEPGTGGYGSPGVEAFRILRTNLMLSPSTDMPRMVAVTSIAEAEGKTTTSAHLGAAFAEHGLKVLLVDLDLRRPQLHDFFRVARSPGLKELLEGSCSPAQAIRATSTECLWVLSAGEPAANTTSVLLQPRMKTALESLLTLYDLIIIDTPPVLVAADATIIGTLAEAVLLVVRAGDTDRGAAVQAMERLGHVGAQVIGVVLNDPDGRVPKYGKYAYY